MQQDTALGWFWSENKQEWQLARIAAEDRAIHLYVLGASGSGKTKFLEFLIRQDLVAGHGCGVIDPHGDLIEDLKQYVTALGASKGERFLREQVVLVDLADPHQTVAFNPIEQLPGVSAGEQAAELISAFRKIWADSWGVRMEDLLRNSLIALSEAQRSLAELPAFLADTATRKHVLEQLSHPIALEYFGRFNRLSDRAQLTWAEPVLNKVNALLANDRVRHLLAAPRSTFNLREVMDSGKILLVKLDKGRLKDSADLLGSLILSKIQLAVFSRSDTPAHRRIPFYLYVDEFQNFASDSFGVLLSEARKYGLSLVLAHQTLAQIPESLQSVILGNVGLHIVFRVNRRDAEKMAKESFAYSGYTVKSATLTKINYWSLGEEWEHYTEELQNQPPRAAYVKHKIQGGLIPIQTADVDPPWQALGISLREHERQLASVPIGSAYLRPRSQLADGRRQPPRRQELPAPTPTPLTEDEHAFLTLVVDEPHATVSELYRRFGASVWKGSKLRADLIAKGYLAEVETRLGKGGKLAKFLIPTFTTLELFDMVPSNGRGGPIHRHVQQLVAAEAEAKGYTTITEHELPSGAIVDVHVANGSETIAVEIACASRLSRELEHIRSALEAGYSRTVTLVFSDELLCQLQSAVSKQLSVVEATRVRVVPMKQVGGVF